MAELDVRTAALQSKTMARYVEGFSREMINSFSEKNAREFLGQALDNLLETAAMLGNVSDRLASHTGEAEPAIASLSTSKQAGAEPVALTQDDRNAIDHGIEAIGRMFDAGDWGSCCHDYINSLHKIAAYLAAPGAAIAAREQDEGLTGQLATAVEAIEAHHDPFCLSVLRGKACDCGNASREEAPATTQAELVAGLKRLIGSAVNYPDTERSRNWVREVYAKIDSLAATPPAAIPAAPSDTTDGFYVASRASIPERPMMWQGLRMKGWPITSTWIDEAGEGETENMGDLWRRIHAEIARSTGVLLYAEVGDFPLKRALIECGIALGMGKPVALVLPHVRLEPRSMKPIGSWASHPLVTRYETLDEARAALTQPTTVQQAEPSDEQLSKVAHKGYNDYWTEDCAGKESEAWLACAKAVLALKTAQTTALPGNKEAA